MPRTDNDSWEITESVGATALGVAAARAADTESDDPLIDDPFARVFLDAAGDGIWNWFGNSDLPDEIAKVAPDVPLADAGHARLHGFADSVFRRVLHRRHRSGRAAGGDSGSRPGFAVVAVAVARRGDGLRARPAAGAGVQVLDVAGAGGAADGQRGQRSGRSAARLADGVAAGRF